MDDLDFVQDAEAENMARAIQAVRNRARSSTLLFSGSCYYCDTPVKSPHVFCNTECRDDWEQEQRLLRMNGRGTST